MKVVLIGIGVGAIVALLAWLKRKTPAGVSSEWLRAQIYEKNGY